MNKSEPTSRAPYLRRGCDAGDKGWRWVWTAGFSAWTPSTHAGIRDRLPDGRFVWILRWASRASPIGCDLRQISSYFETWKRMKHFRNTPEHQAETIKNQNLLKRVNDSNFQGQIWWNGAGRVPDRRLRLSSCGAAFPENETFIYLSSRRRALEDQLRYADDFNFSNTLLFMSPFPNYERQKHVKLLLLQPQNC